MKVQEGSVPLIFLNACLMSMRGCTHPRDPVMSPPRWKAHGKNCPRGFLVLQFNWVPCNESSLTSKVLMRCASGNLKLAYVMSRAPAAKARLYGVTSLLIAVSSRARTVGKLIAGACSGVSLDSTNASDHTNVCVRGQSIPNASAQTVRACFAASGAVRPRSARDSR